MRILMQSRPNLLSQRGGDTIVLERLKTGIERLALERSWDVSISVDLLGQADPAHFDLVHLFNLATTELTTHFAKRAIECGTPYVVTTLYEDIPTFQRPSHLVASRLIGYVASGQQVDLYRPVTHHELSTIAPCSRFPADLIVNNAAVLMANGWGEVEALERDFKGAGRIEVVPLGSEVGELCGPEEFERAYGERDFVLCVGRLESRKNQLMLLKALEDSPLTVILAGGGFSYQPEYEAAIRAFRRLGKTLILGRIEPQMLASAYAACRVHALPSWYELPGLVSLEAAARGKNVVATKAGTTEDYLKDTAFYCSPWDSDSIRSAVSAAYHSPVKPGCIQNATSYSWANTVAKTLDIYTSVVESRTREGASMRQMSDNFLELLERGESAARSGDIEEAQALISQAEGIDPNSVRLLRAKGVLMLSQRRTADALAVFDRALLSDPGCPKLIVGRGMCELLEGRAAQAISYFERALSIQPDYLVALYQLLDASYRSGATDKAVTALERYLVLNPKDTDIRFCLAGCLYQQGRATDALAELEEISKINPKHSGVEQLRELVLGVLSQKTAKSSQEPVKDIAVTNAQSDSVRRSLGELIERVRSWKIANVGPNTIERCNGPQDGELGNTIVLTEDQMVPASESQAEQTKELSASELAEAMGRIEDLKRVGEFLEADRALASLIDTVGGDLSRLEPFREAFECLRAEFLVLQGDLSSAERRYNEVLERNSGSARALCGKGALAAEAGSWNDAKEYFSRALVSDKDCDVAHAGMGLCAMNENQIELAFECFWRATETNPENHRALLGLLQTGYPLKRFNEMERMLSAYLELHPASLDILYSFAGLLFAQGKVAEAKLEVEKILIFEPEHSNALELKGMIGESNIGARAL
jgi:tetratricopeptide (TPR) repeat protein